MNLWAGRRSEKVLRREQRQRREEWRRQIAEAVGGLEPTETTEQAKDTMASITSTRESSEYTTELIPDGFYQLEMRKVGEPRQSTFMKKNGEPADDYAYITFMAFDEDNVEVGEFDGSYSWIMSARYDGEGERVWVSDLQQLTEVFLGREIEDGEEIDFDEEIIRTRRRAQGTVVIGRGKKDPKKTFNRIESILPVKKKKAGAVNGAKPAPAPGDDTPF